MNYQSEVCPDLTQLPGRKSSSGQQQCDLNADCQVTVKDGEKSTYLIYLERDSCGNIIIKPGENGRAFANVDVARISANAWVANCLGKYVPQVEKVVATLNLDNPDYSYLKYLDGIGLNREKFVETVSIDGKGFKIISPEAGFSSSQNKGIVCEADITTSSAINNRGDINVQFSILSDYEPLSGAVNSGSKNLVNEIFSGADSRCTLTGEKQMKCVYQISKAVLQNVDAIGKNMRCNVQASYVGGVGGVKMADSGLHVFNRDCPYDDIILKAQTDVCQQDDSLLKLDGMLGKETYDCYPKVSSSSTGAYCNFLIPYGPQLRQENVFTNFFLRTRQNPLQCFTGMQYVGRNDPAGGTNYCLNYGNEIFPNTYYVHPDWTSVNPGIYLCGFSLPLQSQGYKNMECFVEVYDGSTLLYTAGSFNTGERLNADGNSPPRLFASVPEEPDNIMSNVEIFYNEAVHGFEFKPIILTNSKAALGAKYDNAASIQAKTSFVFEDSESQSANLKFSIGKILAFLPPAVSPTNGVIVYTPTEGTLLNEEEFLTSGVNEGLWLRVCDDGRRRDGSFGEPKCTVKGIFPKLKPKESLRRLNFVGKIDNILPLVGGIRNLAVVSSKGYIVEDPSSSQCGKYRIDSNVRLWFQRDLYDEAYPKLILGKPGDLFDKSLFYPNPDIVGSVVINIRTTFENGQIKMNVKYKEATGDQANSMTPLDLATFDMAGGGEHEEPRNQNEQEMLYQLKEKLFYTILGLYSTYNNVDNDYPALFSLSTIEDLSRSPRNFLPSVTNGMLQSQSLSSGKLTNGQIPWNVNIQPLINSDVDNELATIRNKCNP